MPSSSTTANASDPSSQGSALKKPRRYVPEMPSPEVLKKASACVSDLTVLHQSTRLAFCHRSSSSSWLARGTSSLYLVLSNNGSTQELALNLRGTCRVRSVTVERMQRAASDSSTAPSTLDASRNDEALPMETDDSVCALETLSCTYTHDDPLTHVLVKPASSYTTVKHDTPTYHADSQLVRGATGMTNGLRAASIASHMGELRISLTQHSMQQSGDTKKHDDETLLQLTPQQVEQAWKQELTESKATEGQVASTLRTKLYKRSVKTRQARIALIARRLAEASCGSSVAADDTTTDVSKSSSTNRLRVLKVTVQYELIFPSPKPHHLGGIHVVTHPTPHVYTTAGVVGDHQGVSTFMPCCDSASSHHRASHEWCVQVTAPLKEGLCVVGCGEDFGMTQTHVHPSSALERTASYERAEIDVLGDTVLELLQQSTVINDPGTDSVHVIPPDVASLDAVMATCTWVSQAWTPTSPRSIGFAIGPFKILEDPEYFGGEEEEEEEEAATTTNGSTVDRDAFLRAARENGEGIRQAYFAPLFERKYLHSDADARLLPNTQILLAPLGRRQKERSKRLDEAVLYATAGVPHRALSSMRDVLALPAYRTASYTQVWIPDAVHGGSTSGTLHNCPDVLVNPFLGGGIMDSRLLPQPGYRLPFHGSGRVLQLLQARCAMRGWITSAIPLGGRDDVGMGYILTLVESFLMSLYERGHGAYGEGGAKGSMFFTKRYAGGSGLNSSNFDFLPVRNIEEGELDVVVGGVVGAVPIEDRNNAQLWRTATNGTESHTSALDEFSVRQLLYRDCVEALERGTDKDKHVPLPSMGWLGSHLSLSLLSTNASCSSDLGCGAVELAHPVGGLLYRTLKCEILRQVIEGRAGIPNCIRLVRAAFISAHMEDMGKKEVHFEHIKPKKGRDKEEKTDRDGTDQKLEPSKVRPPFVVCVEEMLKNHGLTHTLFTRALRIIAGPIREPNLRGTLVDVERDLRRGGSLRQFVEPEGFPNSYVRGAAGLYLRVGTHVEVSEGGPSAAGAVAVKGTQLHVLVEPVLPEGGIAVGGPITLRVVENEGQLREFVRTLSSDGSRCEWGPVFLHAKPVTTVKQQTAASGVIESTSNPTAAKDTGDDSASPKGAGGEGRLMSGSAADRVFTDSIVHGGGYQAIELVRLTNLTPLLWIRVDPMGMYAGRMSIVQPDACLAEQLFHDGEAMAQVEAIRALAERPLPLQASVKVKQVYDVDISELPVRVLGDCLRGSPALHSSLPHTPAVRMQAAYAIAQWQNNKAPATHEVVGSHAWIGLNLLVQYFRERYYSNGVIVPVKFTRLVLKNNEASLAAAAEESGAGVNKSGDEDLYHYIDSIEDETERFSALEEADEIELEEDEEWRVRSAVISSIASIRAQNGMTPRPVLDFLEAVLVSGDASMVGTLASMDEAAALADKERGEASLTYNPSPIVADALLALCHVNASPPAITDPATGKVVQAKTKHPVLPLIDASRRWLEWELYRETIRTEVDGDTLCGVGGSSHSTVAACAITALSSLSILRQTTTDPLAATGSDDSESASGVRADFYVSIFDRTPHRADVTRAACAQAIACICCAADRFEVEKVDALGLLTALEFLLDRILDSETSSGLRQTLALLMLDMCTGKICSMQRVGNIGCRADLCASAARFYNGPLGACQGGDNGSAILTTVTEASFPAASAVNDGARRGLRLLTRAGHTRDELSDHIVVRVAKFATALWRTANGDSTPLLTKESPQNEIVPSVGVCAYDSQLRVTLLSLWQWVWPKGCVAALRVQAWKPLRGTQRYHELGAHLVMQITDEEKEAAMAEEASLAEIDKAVANELDRQRWRGEMATNAYRYYREDSASAIKDASGPTEQGIGQPLPPIQRDNAFKQGGWVASAAQQRRALALDGGHAVKKIRFTVKASSGAD